jgi:hypothetical protein
MLMRMLLLCPSALPVIFMQQSAFCSCIALTKLTWSHRGARLAFAGCNPQRCGACFAGGLRRCSTSCGTAGLRTAITHGNRNFSMQPTSDEARSYDPQLAWAPGSYFLAASISADQV